MYPTREASPILFTGSNGKAIYENRKTQTRRVFSQKIIALFRDYNEDGDSRPGFTFGTYRENGSLIGPEWLVYAPGHIDEGVIPIGQCPYGRPGDLLYVKEVHYRFGHWEAVPGIRTKSGRMKWQFVADTEDVLFEAPQEYRKGHHHKDPSTPAWHKRSALFMPRHLSRSLIEITDIRVQRLQDVSADDAIAEGVECSDGSWIPFDINADPKTYAIPVFSFIWDSIHGSGAWRQNNFVWALTFQRVITEQEKS